MTKEEIKQETKEYNDREEQDMKNIVLGNKKQEYKNIIIEEMINQKIITLVESTHRNSKPIIDKFIDELFNRKVKVKKKNLRKEFENFMIDYNSKIIKEEVIEQPLIEDEMIEDETDYDEMWY